MGGRGSSSGGGGRIVDRSKERRGRGKRLRRLPGEEPGNPRGDGLPLRPAKETNTQQRMAR